MPLPAQRVGHLSGRADPADVVPVSPVSRQAGTLGENVGGGVAVLAPIVLFVYNRTSHTRQAIEALASNALALGSTLYIFSDGPKTPHGAQAVDEVRNVIDAVPARRLFGKVEIIKAEHNKGLAMSVIDGVTRVMSLHGRAIILEDDSIPAPDFLEYMNAGLDFYENDPTIWSIGGYNFEMQYPDDYPYDVIRVGRGSSSAWASWQNRWAKVDWQVRDYGKFRRSFAERRRFNSCGNDCATMLDMQMAGYCDSWAIRFRYAMVKNHMYAILPRYSRVRNIGADGSGTHSKRASHRFDTQIIDLGRPIRFAHMAVDPFFERQLRAKHHVSPLILWLKYLYVVVLKVRRDGPIDRLVRALLNKRHRSVSRTTEREDAEHGGEVPECDP